MTLEPPPALILCIDDEPQLLVDVVDELQSAGYVALAADSAAAAYALIQGRRPDLILCDISMPDADGYHVLETLRSAHDLADVPFIFLTAQANRADVIRGRQSGADDYLTKPVDYDLLLATVSSRLAQMRRVRQAHGWEAESLRQRTDEEIRAQGRAGLQLATLALDRVGNGLVMMDTRCTILETNALAVAVLGEGDALRMRGGRLVVASGSLSALEAAITRLENGEAALPSLVLERTGRQPLLVQVTRLDNPLGDARYVAIITDPERPPTLSPQLAVALYGLTPTESKVAAAVANGKRPDDISAEFGIAQSTINFHLNNIFRKTGTTRQADLVALLVRTIVADPDKTVGAPSQQSS